MMLNFDHNDSLTIALLAIPVLIVALMLTVRRRRQITRDMKDRKILEIRRREVKKWNALQEQRGKDEVEVEPSGKSDPNP